MKIIVIIGIYLGLQMCFVWGVYRLLKNPSVVDASWSIGLMVSGLLYLGRISITERKFVVSGLLILWAFRLAGYLWYTRIRQGHDDKRYRELSAHWKINQSLGFFLNFQLQALLIFMISGVFYWIGHSAEEYITVFDIFAIIIVAVGIIGESIADWQLYQFKKTQAKGICNVGFWYYSRHPNYFCDWLIWVGFSLFALQTNNGYLGLLSPMVLYWIFTQVTGPMTERGSLQSRGQKYNDYQKQTSMFFPWFKKKIDSA
jgi:steroid 5-alpha reductase family enzyme